MDERDCQGGNLAIRLKAQIRRMACWSWTWIHLMAVSVAIGAEVGHYLVFLAANMWSLEPMCSRLAWGIREIVLGDGRNARVQPNFRWFISMIERSVATDAAIVAVVIAKSQLSQSFGTVVAAVILAETIIGWLSRAPASRWNPTHAAVDWGVNTLSGIKISKS